MTRRASFLRYVEQPDWGAIIVGAVIMAFLAGLVWLANY